MSEPTTPAWDPFAVLPRPERAPAPRSIHTPEGVTDRIRAAAFAELQAREAFLWAADQFTEAGDSVRTAWRGLALAEDRHLQWLLKRLEQLGSSVKDRPVSDQLWLSLTRNSTASDFAYAMATAEERGRIAGVRFYETLRDKDPESARIFERIAAEEVEHIDLAARYFNRHPNRN